MGGVPSSRSTVNLDTLGSGTEERYYGLVNFGNTCYCNSVLQSLFFCRQFRYKVVSHYEKCRLSPQDDDSLLFYIGELFARISEQKNKTGILAPKNFVAKLHRENVMFSGSMHQDAHEFFNYILNEIGDLLVRNSERTAELDSPSNPIPMTDRGTSKVGGHTDKVSALGAVDLESGVARVQDGDTDGNNQNGDSVKRESKSWMHEIFEGQLVNETKCCCCEAVTRKSEPFLDLSLDIVPVHDEKQGGGADAVRRRIRENSGDTTSTSLTAALRAFSRIETLEGRDKFYCNTCGCLQEARKRMLLSRLPPVLALQLKRFRFDLVDDGADAAGQEPDAEPGRSRPHRLEQRKVANRCVFPMELKLPNTTEDAGEQLYKLNSVVVHLGQGLSHGHYVSLVRAPPRSSAPSCRTSPGSTASPTNDSGAPISNTAPEEQQPPSGEEEDGHTQDWLLFDDDVVKVVDASAIRASFGRTLTVKDDNGQEAVISETGYLLFYEAVL